MSGKSFKFVYIPADMSQQLEERSLMMPAGKEVECLTDELKKHFQQVSGGTVGGSSSMIDVIKEQIRKEHGDEAVANIDPNMLAMFANQQMVDIVALQPGTKGNGFTGVSMYVDDQGVAKKLPINNRASMVAAACGMSLAVNGDAFIARTFDDENNFERKDFTLTECDSAAKWIQVAKAYHAAKAKDGAATASAGTRAQLEQLAAGGVQRPVAGAAPAPARVDESPEERALKLKDQGNGLFKKKKWKAAITAYSAAIELVPSNHVCWANRAACHAALLQWAEAAADSEECIRLDKTFVKAWYRLGRARLELGDIGAAVAAVEAGRPLCPEGEGGPVGARVSDFDALAAMCAEKSTQTEGSTVRGRSTS